MILFIGMILCSLILWAFSHFGIKNYEYDHEESMLTAKIVNLIVFAILLTLISLKHFL
jgi:multisubunit Na+/H+ antiporter MnhB subunit